MWFQEHSIWNHLGPKPPKLTAGKKKLINSTNEVNDWISLQQWGKKNPAEVSGKE